MKVLQYLYGNLNLGGAETMIVNLQKQLYTMDVRFDYIVFKNEKYYYTDQIKEYDGKIISIGSKRDFPLINIFIRWIKLYKAMKRAHYDVFHCNCDTSYRFVELFLAKRAGIRKRIVHCHSKQLEGKGLKWSFKMLSHKICRKLICKFATDYFACSEVASKWMYGRNLNTNKIKIITNGVDTERFKFNEKLRKKYRLEAGILDEELVLCNIGRFYEVKNQRFLINLLKVGLSKGRKMKLYLLGDGPLKLTLEKYAEKIKVKDYVIFTGNVRDTEKYLLVSDVYVMPSLFEGLPVSGVEAQSCGLPIVASDMVSKELNISGNCVFVSLNEPLQKWLKIIEESKLPNESKYEANKIIDSEGYSLRYTAQIVKKAYENYE